MKKVLFVTLVFMAAFVQAEPTVKTVRRLYAPYLKEDMLTVIASFDGSYNAKRWNDIMKFADENRVRFTIFVSGVYYLPSSEKATYHAPPDGEPGRSNIGFGGSTQDVEQRKQFTLRALRKGHDIESHLNGHFNGIHWSGADWTNEINQFNHFCSFLPAPARQVRVPYLSANAQLIQVMPALGLQSVVSSISSEPEFFNEITVQTASGPATVLEFPIDFVRKQDTVVPVMDYTFFEVDQRLALSSTAIVTDMVNIYLEQADRCFKERRPFQLFHHFANMNNGLYWEAEKKTISELNKRYRVDYLTVDELAQKILSAPEKKVAAPTNAIYSAVPRDLMPADNDLLATFWPPNVVLAFQGKDMNGVESRLRLSREGENVEFHLVSKSSPESVFVGKINSNADFELVHSTQPLSKMSGRFASPDKLSGHWIKSDGTHRFTMDRVYHD